MLIVEDEEGPRHALTIILRPFFHLLTAGSQQDALQALRDHHVDLMTLDIRLPDGSGLDVLRTARREYPWVETVVITGYGSLKSSQDALQAGAAGYLLKPFNVRDLIDLLNQTLEKKQRLDYLRGFLRTARGSWAEGRQARTEWAQLIKEYHAIPRAQPVPVPTQGTFTEHLPLLSELIEATGRHWLTHANRVRAYALLMANPMNLSPTKKDILSMGAFLHDIGRIPLGLWQVDISQEEETPDRHPDIGARMVYPFRMPHEAVQIIAQHHEQHDGSGYPNGLKGDAIAPLARIVGIAQAFDHMTVFSAAEPLPIETACERILSRAGSGFEAQLAELFVDQVLHSKERLSTLAST
ncbi:MAG: HD domain-containing phosphohydrolase [Burkholderiales bacterium]